MSNAESSESAIGTDQHGLSEGGSPSLIGAAQHSTA